MPINTRELMQAVGTLTDKEGMKVTLKSRYRRAELRYSELLHSPTGFDVGGSFGGTIDAIAAYVRGRGQFHSVSHIIMHEMSEREREKLKDHIMASLAEFHPTDLAVLLPLLTGNMAAQRAILNTVASFITNEMRLQIID